MLNQPELQTALADTLTGRPQHLVVDLAAVTFCWVQGLALLAGTAEITTASGTGYALSGLSAPSEGTSPCCGATRSPPPTEQPPSR
jgi:hypothetical protein